MTSSIWQNRLPALLLCILVAGGLAKHIHSAMYHRDLLCSSQKHLVSWGFWDLPVQLLQSSVTGTPYRLQHSVRSAVLQVAEEAVSSTVDALSEAVNLSHLFKGLSAASASRYALKSIICYFGHHYQVYALSEELDQWLLFDDTNIQLIGDWQDVKAKMRCSRLQPSVLFYERLG